MQAWSNHLPEEVQASGGPSKGLFFYSLREKVTILVKKTEDQELLHGFD